MKDYILLIFSMFANLSGCLLKKFINDKYENNLFAYQFYNSVVSFSAALCLFILAENFSISFYTVIMALIFGTITLFQQLFNLLALETGPFSYTNVIISLSTLIPTLSGAIFWNEKISFIQICGILLLILCLVLSVDFSNKDKKTNMKWFIYSMCAFATTGLIGVMQKIHQTSIYKDELDVFLITSFVFSFIISSILAALFNKKRLTSKSTSKTILSFTPIVLLLLSGIFVAVNNKFNLYLSGILDSAIFFPLVNGGGLILSSIFSVIVFKEKLSHVQWLGLVIGIISTILICIPIK